MDFKGKTVAIIGSGPSLCSTDCGLVNISGLPTMAINSSWVQAPFADVIFAGDYLWWKNNHDNITIAAEKWTSCADSATRFRLNHYYSKLMAWNSGLRAIELAEMQGATRAILIGFDCRVDFGRHWHPDHVGSSNPNPKVCNDWRGQFNRYARNTKMEIINCSRDTALLCFPRLTLEEVLCYRHFQDVTRPKVNTSCEAL